MSEFNELHRDIGRLEGHINSLKPGLQAEIDALKARFDQQNLEIASMRKDIRQMLDFTTQARASWRTLMALGGFSAAVGALIAKFAPVIWSK